MSDVDGLLAEAFEDLGRRAPHDPDLLATVRRQAGRQRALVASVAAVLAVVGLSAVVAARPGRAPAPVLPAGGATAAPTPVLPTATPARCPSPETGVLPRWAWTGFSHPEEGGVPFVRGARGEIVAVLFGYPLLSPPGPDRSNKVLWVPRVAGEGSEVLEIEARLEGTGPVVRRQVQGGPGPSIVDLPAPGCWRLDLRWGKDRDSLSLRYAQG